MVEEEEEEEEELRGRILKTLERESRERAYTAEWRRKARINTINHFIGAGHGEIRNLNLDSRRR